MKIVNYLSKSEYGGINSGKDVQYFLTPIEIHPHSHPLYIGRCIREHEELIGLGAKNKHYSSVIAIWEGDLYDSFDEVSNKLRSNQKWIQSYQWELEKKINTLQSAITLHEEGLFSVNENKVFN